MQNISKNKLLLLLLAFANLLFAAGKTFCFEAVRGEEKVYLLGSIHMATKELYPLPKVIEKAFASTKVLVVEADVTNVDQAAMQKVVQEKGIFTGEQDLTKILSAAELKELKSYAAGVGVPVEMISKMKPWLAVLTLSALKAQKEGLKPEFGIDIHFLNQAKDKKTIRELEGIIPQIDLLSGFSDEEQKDFLTYTIKSEKRNKDALKNIIKFWKDGNIAALEKLLLSEFKDVPVIEKKFLFDRNVQMIDRILYFVKSDKELFVIAGAAHLVGDKGIIKLLEQKGFTVKQLEK